MRISDWSSDVCSSDLYFAAAATTSAEDQSFEVELASSGQTFHIPPDKTVLEILAANGIDIPVSCEQGICGTRSEEHTSALQSLMRIAYAVFCLTNKKLLQIIHTHLDDTCTHTIM